jgi:hypothetical protein
MNHRDGKKVAEVVGRNQNVVTEAQKLKDEEYWTEEHWVVEQGP